MKILSFTQWIPAQAGDVLAQPGIEYTLGTVHTVRVHTQEGGLEYMSLPKGTVLKKLSGDKPAEWEVTLPIPEVKDPRVRPISRRALVQILENPEIFSENTMERPSEDYRPYALALDEKASLREGLAVMLRLPSARIPLPLPYTGESGGRGMYKALDQLPVWARIIMPDDRTGPFGTAWERVFQKTPKGWRDCGLRKEGT